MTEPILAPVELAPELPVPAELAAQVTGIAWEVLRATAWPAEEPHAQAAAEDAARTVLGLASGYLRGRVPAPLPRDLRAVLVAASTRYAWMLGRNRGVKAHGREDLPDPPPFYGFLALELVVLNRYRVRLV